MQKVTNLIDVSVSCEDVFDIITDIRKRMQLSPLWGCSRLLGVSPDFPIPGSSYRVELTAGVHFEYGQDPLDSTKNAFAGLAQVLLVKLNQADLKQIKTPFLNSATPVTNEGNQTGKSPVTQEYYVAEYEPPCKFTYFLEAGCKTVVTWTLQEIPFGTRLRYQEEFCDEMIRDDQLIPLMRQVISQWLFNIKRYSELRGSRGGLVVKWFLDHFYLRLRPDQRRVVLVMIFMQAVGLIAFSLALIGWGITNLLVLLYSLGS